MTERILRSAFLIVDVLKRIQLGDTAVAPRAGCDALSVEELADVFCISTVVEKDFRVGPFLVSYECGHDTKQVILMGESPCLDCGE